jgi:periplasmic divalent cation tolerance protein
MEKKFPYVMLMISAPAEAAHDLARALVDEGAAACAQVTPPVTSYFYWEEEVKGKTEVLLFIKTTAAKLDDVKRILATHHPYQIPELIEIPLSGGNPAYFRWIDEVLARGDKRA